MYENRYNKQLQEAYEAGYRKALNEQMQAVSQDQIATFLTSIGETASPVNISALYNAYIQHSRGMNEDMGTGGGFGGHKQPAGGGAVTTGETNPDEEKPTLNPFTILPRFIAWIMGEYDNGQDPFDGYRYMQ